MSRADELDESAAVDVPARASSVASERLTLEHVPRVAKRRVGASASRQHAAMDRRGDELRSVKTGAMVAPARARVARRELAMT